MSILKLIANANISELEIQGMTDIGIIRLEKKLKAEVKMNDDLDKNQVDQILSIFRKYRPELKSLYSIELENLYKILLDNTLFYVFDKSPETDEIDPVKTQKFLHRYFQETMQFYIINCIKKNRYDALLSLLHYVEILPFFLVDMFVEKLFDRIYHATEILNLEKQKDQVKIPFIFDEYFYITLNKLGANQFEDAIVELIDSSVGNLKFSLRKSFMKAISYYEAEDEYLVEYIDKHSGRDRSDKTELNEQNTEENPGDMTEEKKEKNSIVVNGCLGLFLLTFILLIIYFFVTMFSDSSADTLINEFRNSTIESAKTCSKEGYFETKYEGVENKRAFQRKIEYVANSSTNIISQKDVAFRISETHYTAFEGGEKYSVLIEIINSTDKNTVIYLDEGIRHSVVFLLPLEKIAIPPTVHSLAIYVGESPQMVAYEDKNGMVRETFRFNDFSAEDSILLHKYDNLYLTFDEQNKYTLELIQTGSTIELKRSETYNWSSEE